MNTHEAPSFVGHHYAAGTIDDLMYRVVRGVLDAGSRIEPSKGPALDLAGASLVLANPRARLSRSEARGKATSAIAELCWYLSGSADLRHITHYLPRYEESAEADGRLMGAYGPRLFGDEDGNQIDRVVEQLRQKPSSRQAVVQLLRASDLSTGQKDVPCTVALQFLVREDRVILIVFMRSNDILWGLPHDVFAFTMLQEIVASELGHDVGSYVHHVGSLHLYEDRLNDAQAFLAEGLQATDQTMPSMPHKRLRTGIEELLSCEEAMRNGANPSEIDLPEAPYWRDLAVMLATHEAFQDDRVADAIALAAQLTDPFYKLFIEDRVDRTIEQNGPA